MDDRERAVIARMMEGDDGAFDEVYRSCSGKLYRMALFITGNRNDSEDVLQETFVKCYLHRAELKDPERFEAWIYQILVRTAWHMEKKKKETARFLTRAFSMKPGKEAPARRRSFRRMLPDRTPYRRS